MDILRLIGAFFTVSHSLSSLFLFSSSPASFVHAFNWIQFV